MTLDLRLANETFTAPPLRPIIGDVVGLRSEKKMIRIDAGRHIATVQHPKACGDRAASHRPRNTVSAFSLAVDPEFAIAGPVDRASPNLTAAFGHELAIEFDQVRERERSRAAAVVAVPAFREVGAQQIAATIAF